MFVVKYGGSFMDDFDLVGCLCVVYDIVFFVVVGINVVVVYGGGKVIMKVMEVFGLKVNFVNGMCVIDVVMIVIVKKMFDEIVNKDVCDVIV